MADNNTNQGGAQSAGNEAVPSWLKKAQEKNSQYASDQTATQSTQAASSVAPVTTVAVAEVKTTSPLDKIKALENHESQAKLDDAGKVVLDNVTSSAEDEKAKNYVEELLR